MSSFAMTAPEMRVLLGATGQPRVEVRHEAVGRPPRRPPVTRAGSARCQRQFLLLDRVERLNAGLGLGRSFVAARGAVALEQAPDFFLRLLLFVADVPIRLVLGAHGNSPP